MISKDSPSVVSPPLSVLAETQDVHFLVVLALGSTSQVYPVANHHSEGFVEAAAAVVRTVEIH